MILWMVYMVTFMILFDLLLHIEDVLYKYKIKRTVSLTLYNLFHPKRGKARVYSWKRYNIFWITYWSIAFMLCIFAIIL